MNPEQGVFRAVCELRERFRTRIVSSLGRIDGERVQGLLHVVGEKLRPLAGGVGYSESLGHEVLKTRRKIQLGLSVYLVGKRLAVEMFRGCERGKTVGYAEKSRGFLRPTDADTIIILVEFIRKPDRNFDELANHLAKKKVFCNADTIKNLFIYYGLEKKIPKMPKKFYELF